MDVRAIVILGAPPDGRETIAGNPLALTDVLGKPVVFRMIERMKAAGVDDVRVITEAATSCWPVGCVNHGQWSQASAEQIWTKAEQAFEEYIDAGAEIVLAFRVGAYAELNYDDLLQHHVNGKGVTCVVDKEDVPLNLVVISASRRNDASYLLRNQLRESRPGTDVYRFEGYVNRLTSAHDLRTLGIDALMQRIELSPEGKQIKPGVWAGTGSKIHRRARIVGPAFIGVGSRVRAAAVVTRCSTLERHTVVDCGTVVENVSTLPYTYVGAGLDVTHSVVGDNRVWNLKRNVEVEFADPRLIGKASPNAPLRALGSLMSLASFLPIQLVRGLFTKPNRECPTSLPDALSTPAAALETPANRKPQAPAVDAGEFPGNLVIARRYGGNE